MDHQYFEGILEDLKNKSHSEIYHQRKGNHPGEKWYLKTVCPMPNLKQIDRYGYGSLWYNISQEQPKLVKIIPHAYDWCGNEIPYMASVWINVEYDIIIQMDNSIGGLGLDVIMVNKKTGDEFYLDNLRQLIEINKESSVFFENRTELIEQLNAIDEIADVINNNISSEEAKYIRKKFKILDGGKNDKSS